MYIFKHVLQYRVLNAPCLIFIKDVLKIHMSKIDASVKFRHKADIHFQVTLDISCNFIEDKGIVALASSILKMPKGMHHLNLSHCSLTNKGISQLSQSLLQNKLSVNTLTYLNLCGNIMKDDSQALCSFLAQVKIWHTFIHLTKWIGVIQTGILFQLSGV